MVTIFLDTSWQPWFNRNTVLISGIYGLASPKSMQYSGPFTVTCEESKEKSGSSIRVVVEASQYIGKWPGVWENGR